MTARSFAEEFESPLSEAEQALAGDMPEEPVLTEQQIKTKRAAGTMLGRAVGFLSRRDYSRFELKGKLMRLSSDYPDEDIEGVLNRLEKLGYLSDRRFAESFVRAKHEKFGNARLRFELKKRGIPGAVVNETIAEMAPSESGRAYEVWSRKFSAYPEDQKEKAKQIRFLLSRGFSYGDVMKTLDRVREEEDARDPDDENGFF